MLCENLHCVSLMNLSTADCQCEAQNAMVELPKCGLRSDESKTLQEHARALLESTRANSSAPPTTPQIRWLFTTGSQCRLTPKLSGLRRRANCQKYPQACSAGVGPLERRVGRHVT